VTAEPMAARAMADGSKNAGKQKPPPPMPVDDAHFAYIRANLIATFYHEFAHALIDLLVLPVLGQEEDAADILSVLMLNMDFRGEELEQLARDAARAFRADAIDREENDQPWAWADEHGPEWQRYYNFVCLHFGAAPDLRRVFAETMGLPEARAGICPDEFMLASRSWGFALARVKKGAPGESIRFRSHARRHLHKRAAATIHAAVKRLNRSYVLPKQLRVIVKHCRDDSPLSAFYTPDRISITVCTEYIDDLLHQARTAGSL